MMKSRLHHLLALLATFGTTSAQVHWRIQQQIRKPPIYQHASAKQATFQQWIDHSDHSLGTFSQRYWINEDYRTGNNSPVVLLTPGEVNAEDYVGYAYDGLIAGAIAKAVGGAAIVLEHRYWGQSSPFQDLTTANLQYLTVNNSISDLVVFANTVELPFKTSTQTFNADKVPWVLAGGSYAGALAAYTMAISPETFFAAYASSAPVQTISNYWQYFSPIQQAMPKNCSTDVIQVIRYLDGILESGNDTAMLEAKAQFGLDSVDHNDDFAQALQNAPWLWQSDRERFQEWCDYVENHQDSGPDGVGLDAALQGYADWMQEVYLPQYCNNNPSCFNSYRDDSSWLSDTSVDNAMNRQWMFLLCNEPLGFWQTGDSGQKPSIVSRLITAEYWSRQCGYYFPPGENNATYGIKRGKKQSSFNSWTGGWDIVETKNISRIIFVDGGQDPWSPAGVSSRYRPGGPLNSTEDVMVHFLESSTHTCDMVESCVQDIEGGQDAWDASIQQMKDWVQAYTNTTGSNRHLEIGLLNITAALDAS